MKKVGLALEGGGARGSFHIGAVRALIEEGYEFGGVVGTSVGAINGSLIAQGDFDKLYDFWYDMKPSDILDVDDEAMSKIMNKHFDKSARSFVRDFTKEVISDKGIDTKNLRKVMEVFLDEEKLRNSDVDFGLVTVALSDKKQLELTKSQIPEGKILDYIMASSRLPVFKQETIDNKYFLDGGFVNNLPVDMLGKMGIFDVISVRTFALGKVPKVKDERIKVRSIVPSEDLGFILNFDNELMRRNIQMGYYDAKRMLHGYKGEKYYVDCSGVSVLERLLAIDDDVLKNIHAKYGNQDGDGRRMLLENVLPSCATWLKVPQSADYEQLLCVILEKVIEHSTVEKYRVYSFDEFLSAAKREVVEGKWPANVYANTKNTLAEGIKLLLEDERQYDVIAEIVKAL